MRWCAGRGEGLKVMVRSRDGCERGVPAARGEEVGLGGKERPGCDRSSRRWVQKAPLSLDSSQRDGSAPKSHNSKERRS